MVPLRTYTNREHWANCYENYTHSRTFLPLQVYQMFLFIDTLTPSSLRFNNINSNLFSVHLENSYNNDHNTKATLSNVLNLGHPNNFYVSQWKRLKHVSTTTLHSTGISLIPSRATFISKSYLLGIPNGSNNRFLSKLFNNPF